MDNFEVRDATPTWTSSVGAGVHFDYSFDNLHVTAGLMVPLLRPFDLAEAVHFSARVFLSSPVGKVFTDKFFFEINLFRKRFKCSFGSVESF